MPTNITANITLFNELGHYINKLYMYSSYTAENPRARFKSLTTVL